MLLVANSTPIVDFDSRLNSLRVNRERRLDLPTPESPINTTVCVVGGGGGEGETDREREREGESVQVCEREKKS